MPSLNTILLLPPQDWSEFEDLCRDLWARIWKDPDSQRNGRSGQHQDGVDVFGYPNGGLSVEGIQCRVKNPWLGQSLTPQEVTDAAESAEVFKPTLSRLYIATTSPRDARLQEQARLLSDSRLREGKFPVSIAFWEEIQSKLVEHEDLLRKYYAYIFSVRLAGRVEGPAAPSDLRGYLDRFQQHITVDLPPLLPVRLGLNEQSVELLDLKKALAETGILHLYGPSGTGKSHLAKHLSIDLISERCVPILIPAKYYSGDLPALLHRSVEHLTTVTAESLIHGSLAADSAPLLILDGFNECPTDSRADLVRAVQALQLRTTPRIVITSRPEVSCDSALLGPVFTLALLGQEERDRLIAYYGAPPGSIAEVLRTPLDVCVAAESATHLTGGSATQYDLFHAYARGRLAAGADRAFGFLALCASTMSDLLTSALSEATFYRLAQTTAGADAGRVLEVARESGLLVHSHGYVAFWHEKIQRFFQAEALLRQKERESLADTVSSPRNEDALEFLLCAISDGQTIRALLPVLPSADLYLGIARGEFGRLAAAALHSAIRDLLAKAHEELTTITVVKSQEITSRIRAVSITSTKEWTDYERRLSSFLGDGFVEGLYCEEIIELIDRTERKCRELTRALFPKRPWSYYPALYAGIGLSTLPSGRIVQRIAARFWPFWSSAARTTLSPRLRDLEQQVSGILLVLHTYARDSFWHATEPDPAIQLVALLRRMWASGLHHLRFEAAQLAQSVAVRVDEPLRSELEALLESFLGDDPLLNTAVFEALAQYRDLGITSTEQARAEIREVLDGPRDKEACRKAAAIFTNQFEEVFGEHYYDAVGELEGSEQIDFHVMAALGIEIASLSFLDSIMRRLIEFGAPEARPAMEKWSSCPSPQGIITDELGGVFLLAHIGLARVAEALPTGEPPSSDDEESWRTWGEILFWLHRLGVSEDLMRESCASCWRALQGRLLLASVDPLFEMERYVRTRRVSGAIYKPVSSVFPRELKGLYERALPMCHQWTSLYRSVAHDRGARALFVIDELSRLGDEESVLLLQQYIESEPLGRAAVRAIKSIRERLAFGAPRPLPEFLRNIS